LEEREGILDYLLGPEGHVVFKYASRRFDLTRKLPDITRSCLAIVITTSTLLKEDAFQAVSEPEEFISMQEAEEIRQQSGDRRAKTSQEDWWVLFLSLISVLFSLFPFLFSPFSFLFSPCSALVSYCVALSSNFITSRELWL
jgi:hypothetical protein